MYIYLYNFKCVCVCLYVYVLSIYIYIYTNIYIYKYLYIYIYIYILYICRKEGLKELENYPYPEQREQSPETPQQALTIRWMPLHFKVTTP